MHCVWCTVVSRSTKIVRLLVLLVRTSDAVACELHNPGRLGMCQGTDSIRSKPVAHGVQVLQDPKQKRFFKSKDMQDLFTLGDEYSQETETAAIFSTLTSADVRPEDDRPSTPQPAESALSSEVTGLSGPEDGSRTPLSGTSVGVDGTTPASAGAALCNAFASQYAAVHDFVSIGCLHEGQHSKPALKEVGDNTCSTCGTTMPNSAVSECMNKSTSA